MLKAVIYARVSTKDQDEETQVQILTKAAEIHNWNVVDIYRDKISGTKDSRPGLDRMVKDLREGLFEAILVLRLDRLGRNQVQLLWILQECRIRGAHIIALNDGIDTTTAIGRVIFSFLAALAEMERERIQERTQEKMERMKASGIKLGRPSMVDPSTIGGKRRRSWIMRLHQEGKSQRAISREVGVSRDVVRKVIKGWSKKVPPSLDQKSNGGTPPGGKRSLNDHMEDKNHGKQRQNTDKTQEGKETENDDDR